MASTENDIRGASHQAGAMKCVRLPVENAGKWHICHPDAQWLVIDVIGNLTLWSAPLILTATFSNKGAASAGGERVLEQA